MPATTQAMLADQDFRIDLVEVELPEPKPDSVIIRALSTGVSIGTESLWLRQHGGEKPVVTGYQGIGVVETVGAEVTGYAPGDRVAYRGTKGLRSQDGEVVSVNGGHCAHAVCPADQLVMVPPDLDPSLACFFVSAGTGIHGLDRAQPKVGDWVLVQGCGLVGLGVVAGAVLRGARVIAVDKLPDRLAAASSLGAEVIVDAGELAGTLAERVAEITGDGAAMVFEATGAAACIPAAVACCRRHGTFVYQGNYGDGDVAHRFYDTHGKELTLINTCGYGRDPAARAFFRLLELGAVDWGSAVTHRLAPADAAPVLDAMLAHRRNDVLGLAIEWSAP